jgi:hypothetical protein
MKKHLWLLLSLTSLSCHKSEQPVAPDAATKVAGIYDLTSITAYNKSSTSTPGSLTLVRINAQAVRPTFHITGIQDGLIEQGTWSLAEINEDSIFYRGSGYGGGIKNGRIDMFGYADGTIYFRFAKKQ